MRVKKLVLTTVTALIAAIVIAGTICEIRRLPQTPPPEPLPDALIVFCFYGNDRSETADTIETYTRELLGESFAEEFEQGKIVLRALNYEEPKNAHFKEELELDAATVVLVDGRANRPKIAKNLQKKVAESIHDKEVFKLYLREQIDKLHE